MKNEMGSVQKGLLSFIFYLLAHSLSEIDVYLWRNSVRDVSFFDGRVQRFCILMLTAPCPTGEYHVPNWDSPRIEWNVD